MERDFKNRDGGKETDFIDCVAWRKTDEFVSKCFSKGQTACVSGRLQMRDWTDKDGGKRRNAEKWERWESKLEKPKSQREGYI